MEWLCLFGLPAISLLQEMVKHVENSGLQTEGTSRDKVQNRYLITEVSEVVWQTFINNVNLIFW